MRRPHRATRHGPEMLWTVLLTAGIGLGAACSPASDRSAADDHQGAAHDTLSQRQRDSLIGASRLPGAQGVRGALRAADSARARAERLDSIGGSH